MTGNPIYNKRCANSLLIPNTLMRYILRPSHKVRLAPKILIETNKYQPALDHH